MTGILPIDKPTGPSSHDMVAVARRALGLRRIGHTGTLDPFASGLLLLCIGRATRLAEYLIGLDKVYEATARLGMATDTLDHTGTVVASGDWTGLEAGAIRSAFEGQAGARLQTPPAYSAKKLGGRKAYELARSGEAVTPEPVEIAIHELTVTAIDGEDVSFRARASSGTYIRAIARDAGETLGVGAHLTALRRTGIGEFGVEDALARDRLGDAAAVAAALIDPLPAMAHMPTIEVDEAEARRISHGQRLSAAGRPGRGVVTLARGNELVAVAESDGETIRPRKVFT